MNRRNFLKLTGICVVLPFVGSLSAEGKIDLTRKMYANAINDMESDAKRRSGTRLATEDEFQDALTEVVKGKLICTWKGKLKCGGQNGTLCPQCKYN